MVVVVVRRLPRVRFGEGRRLVSNDISDESTSNVAKADGRKFFSLFFGYG